MTDIMQRRAELETRINELIDEFSDVLSPMGQYLTAVARGQEDDFTSDEIDNIKECTAMADYYVTGWVLGLTSDRISQTEKRGSILQGFAPNAQNTILTAGIHYLLGQ